MLSPAASPDVSWSQRHIGPGVHVPLKMVPELSKRLAGMNSSFREGTACHMHHAPCFLTLVSGDLNTAVASKSFCIPHYLIPPHLHAQSGEGREIILMTHQELET